MSVAAKPKRPMLEQIAELFLVPLPEAARRLDICAAQLKRVCRSYGIARWPQRKLASLQRAVQLTSNGLSLSPSAVFVLQENLHSLRQLRSSTLSGVQELSWDVLMKDCDAITFEKGVNVPKHQHGATYNVTMLSRSSTGNLAAESGHTFSPTQNSYSSSTFVGASAPSAPAMMMSDSAADIMLRTLTQEIQFNMSRGIPPNAMQLAQLQQLQQFQYQQQASIYQQQEQQSMAAAAAPLVPNVQRQWLTSADSTNNASAAIVLPTAAVTNELATISAPKGDHEQQQQSTQSLHSGTATDSGGSEPSSRSCIALSTSSSTLNGVHTSAETATPDSAVAASNSAAQAVGSLNPQPNDSASADQQLAAIDASIRTQQETSRMLEPQAVQLALHEAMQQQVFAQRQHEFQQAALQQQQQQQVMMQRAMMAQQQQQVLMQQAMLQQQQSQQAMQHQMLQQEAMNQQAFRQLVGVQQQPTMMFQQQQQVQQQLIPSLSSTAAVELASADASWLLQEQLRQVQMENEQLMRQIQQQQQDLENRAAAFTVANTASVVAARVLTVSPSSNSDSAVSGAVTAVPQEQVAEVEPVVTSAGQIMLFKRSQFLSSNSQ